MENLNFKWVTAFLGGLTYILFGNDSQVIHSMQWLLYLMGADLITGFIKGHLQGEGNSRTFRNGVLKKFVNIIFVSFCYHVDMNMSLPFSVAILSIGTFTAIEGYSVVENFIQLGVPVPDKMKQMFLVTKEGGVDGK